MPDEPLSEAVPPAPDVPAPERSEVIELTQPKAAPKRWKRHLRDAAEVGFMVFAFATLLMWCSIPNTKRLATQNPASTAFIDLRREQAADAGKPWDLKWQWKPIGKISRYLRAAVVYAEDYKFYEHTGVDWHAIEQAIDRNLDKGELAIGGSTITQQLAKNLYLSPSRSFIRKIREMLIAFSLEDDLTKTRILELYLNVAEWGDGVFGAEAAARKWYGRSAQSLTPAQAARLAVALPNPITRAPDVDDPVLVKKCVRLVRLFRMQGLISATQEREALDAVGAPDEKVLPDRVPPGQTPEVIVPIDAAPAQGPALPPTEEAPTPPTTTPTEVPPAAPQAAPPADQPVTNPEQSAP